MKGKLCKFLSGAGILVLTVIWSGTGQAGPPSLPIEAAESLISSSQQFAVPGLAPSSQLAANGRHRRDVLPERTVTRKSELVVIDQELLAKASFPALGPAADARASFIEPRWLSGRLQRLERNEGNVEGMGPGERSTVTEPLSLFLLGTGMFGLAAFKRRRKK